MIMCFINDIEITLYLDFKKQHSNDKTAAGEEKSPNFDFT